MIETKIYLYDSAKNDYKGEDLSKYLVLGDNLVDTLDEELDTFTITLEGYPTRDEFAPSTKMILEKWDTENGESILSRSCHMVVNSDVVTQPVMSNNGFFTHNIDLFEASAVAQGRVVDNIAVTYKLKDVKLDTTVTYPDTKAKFVVNNIDGSDYEPYKPEIVYRATFSDKFYSNSKFVWEIGKEQLSQWEKLKEFNLSTSDNPFTISLPLPKLMLKLPTWGGDYSTYNDIGEVSYDINITEISRVTGEAIQHDPILVNAHENWNATSYYQSGKDFITVPDRTIIDHLGELQENTSESRPLWYCKKLAEVDANAPTTIDLTCLPDYIYEIVLTIHNFQSGELPDFGLESVWRYNAGLPFDKCYRYAYAEYIFWWNMSPNIVRRVSNATLSFGVRFLTYTQGEKEQIFKQPPPANAYDLFLKCQYASSTYTTEDVAQDSLLFYMSKDDIALLQKTTIVENFYYQKNFWQMLLEIGKYIHSIPKIKFGKDDRYLVTWRKLGISDQSGEVEKNLGVMSIFNNRSLENYISSCSSYVNNAVQIGGVIEEKIVPKTSSDTYLISNNTANLRVSKPIIEIVDMTATVSHDGYTRDTGTTVDLTGNTIPNVWKNTVDEKSWTNETAPFALSINLPNIFPNAEDIIFRFYDENDNLIPTTQYTSNIVGSTSYILILNSDTKLTGHIEFDLDTQFKNGFVFAKEIYNLLNNEEADSPTTQPLDTNKGRAIYYSQGSTTIEGLTYRLPTVSSGTQIDQYAIKRILGLAFNIPTDMWSKILVNDFYFTIKYRTKDNLRNEQSRPDLRHYLINSKYDKYPHHKQFNNQEDTLVDARKMGNNVYGKLIKTGNTEYMVVEYRLKDSNTKTAGELWKLEGNLYYVTKVKNTYYGNYVISEVTFSKDFNKLSAVIGIPSEPRFYEISEQSKIDRDVVFNHYLTLGTDSRFLNASDIIRNQHFKLKWAWLQELMFSNNKYDDQPNGVVTIFKSSENNIYDPEYRRYIYSPISAYTFHNTLSLEWDMVDNFSAGNKVGNTINPVSTDIDDAYRTMLPVGYKDVFGRVDKVDFFICDNRSLMSTDINERFTKYQNLPELSSPNEVNLLANDSVVTTCYDYGQDSQTHGIVVKLDNREVFKGNYNLQMLTDSDRFVLSSYLWNMDKNGLKIALLDREVNKIVGETLPTSSIVEQYDIGDNITILTDELVMGTGEDYGLHIQIGNVLTNVDLSKIKAIAFIDSKRVPNDITNSNSYFVCARNISGLSDEDKRKDWYITYTDQSFFKKQ